VISTPKATLTTAATREPITVAEAKKQLEIPEADTQHDDYLSDVITVARERVEHDTGIVLLSSTWTYKLDEWPCEYITLPIRPLVSVTSISYLDTAGASQTLSSSLYEVDTSRVRPAIWPTYQATWPSLQGIQNAVTVTFVAGYANVDAIPGILRHAVKIAVAAEFEDRTGMNSTLQVDCYEKLISRYTRTSYP